MIKYLTENEPALHIAFHFERINESHQIIVFFQGDM